MSNTPDNHGSDHDNDTPHYESDPPTPSVFIDWLRHWWDAPREKSKATEWAVIGLTICIVIAAFWSAFIFQDQLRETREDFRTDQRAWIGIMGWEVPGKLEIGKPLVLKIVFKNTGKTPASHVQFVGVADPRPVTQLPDFIYSGHGEEVASIATPHGSLTANGYDDN